MDELTRQKISELSEEYLRHRNDQMQAKNLAAQMALAKQRGELIEKRLVQRQASYIAVTLRQAMLNFPSRYSRRMVGLHNEHQARQALTKAAHEFLKELAGFAEKAIDPGWLVSVEAQADGKPGETGKPPPQATGTEITREQEKVKARRQKKTESMRKLRAEGRA